MLFVPYRSSWPLADRLLVEQQVSSLPDGLVAATYGRQSASPSNLRGITALLW